MKRSYQQTWLHTHHVMTVVAGCVWVMQFDQSLSNCLCHCSLSPQYHQGLSGCFVSVLLWHVLLKNIKSQSALFTSCSPQLLSSWSSWPWWPSVTLQSLSARMEKSPTRLHLQVDHTFINTASGIQLLRVQYAALVLSQTMMCVRMFFTLILQCLGAQKRKTRIRMANKSSFLILKGFYY